LEFERTLVNENGSWVGFKLTPCVIDWFRDGLREADSLGVIPDWDLKGIPRIDWAKDS
jgi:hypothetical protein